MPHSASAGFYAPRILDVPEVNHSLTISVDFSSVTAPNMCYRKLYDNLWTCCSVATGSCTISPSDLERIGTYEYFFNESGGERFPQDTGTFKFSVNVKNDALKNKSISFVEHDPQYVCDPWGTNSGARDYSCTYEHMQAYMMANFWENYKVTGNGTYMDKAMMLATSAVEVPVNVHATCDHFDNEFDCKNKAGGDPGNLKPIPSSTLRQASMIYSLWRAHQIRENNTIKSLAEKYTMGSAADCDVWSTDFNCTCDSQTNENCSTSDNQGFMMLAYWKAYEMTGNGTYRGIAENLTDNALGVESSEYLVRGLWKAYEMTGDSTYYGAATKATDEILNVCRSDDCEPVKRGLNIVALWESYEQTERDEYLRGAIDKTFQNTSGSCSAWAGNFACEKPTEQGIMGFAFLKAYQVYSNTSRGIYAPRFLKAPKSNENLTVKVSFKGFVENPRMYYGLYPGGESEYCNISLETGTCMIPAENIGIQGVYSYFFNESGGVRFPKGKFRVALSVGNKNFRDKATGFAEKDSADSYCDPAGSKAGVFDYSCDYENMQAWVISSFWNSYLMTGEYKYFNVNRNLALSQYCDYEPAPGAISTCDHADLDYDCQLNTLSLRYSGAIRQAALIYSLWESYQNESNMTIKVLAEKYTLGSASDCDVWSGDFNCTCDPPDIYCSTPDNQGFMALAYWKAYEMSGSEIYGDIAENLTRVSMSMNGSEYLVRGFWKAYEMTGNLTYYDKAVELADEVLDSCLNGDECTSMEYANNLIALWKSYEQTTNDTYMERAFNKSVEEVTGICNGPAYNFTCATPDEQGAMTVAYWKAYQVYPISGGDITVNLTVQKNSTVYEEFNITVFINNTNVQGLERVDIVSNTGSGLEYLASPFYDLFDGDHTLRLNVSQLLPGESKTFVWTIRAVGGGPQSIFVGAYEIKGASGENGTSVEVSIPGEEVFWTNLSLPETTPVDEEFDMCLLVKNDVFYKLYNVTVNLNLSSRLSTTSLEINRSTAVNISSCNSTIIFDELLPGEAILLNWTVLPDAGAIHNVSVNLSSHYGGVGNVTGNVTVDRLGGVFEANLTAPETSMINEEFVMSLLLRNNVSYRLYNVTASLNLSYGLNVTAVAINITQGMNASIDNLTVVFYEFLPNESKFINWTVLGVEGGLYDIFVNVSSVYGGVGNLSWNITVIVPPPDEEVVVGGGSSTLHCGEPPEISVEEIYDYSIGKHMIRQLIMENPKLVETVESILGEKLIGMYLEMVVEATADVFKCIHCSRKYESTGGQTIIHLFINYSCSLAENFIIYDVLPKSFANSSDLISVNVSVEDVMVDIVEEDPIYSFMFPELRDGDRIRIDYTVNKSTDMNFLEGLLEETDKPMILAAKSIPMGVDNDAPEIEIVFPRDNQSVLSDVFDLKVRYYDENDVSCSYSVDGVAQTEMGDYGRFVKYSKVNTSQGRHVIFVVCTDIFNNSNSSSVVFYVVDTVGESVLVNETRLTRESFFILMAVFLGVLFYLYRRRYVSYFLLCGLLVAMYLFNRVGRVRYTLKFYPVMLRLYESLDGNPKMKKGLYLRKDISKVVRVLELYAVVNKVYDSVVENDVDRERLWHSLVSIKKLYDGVISESLTDMTFLEQIRRKYIYCANYLADGLQGGSDGL